jgi:hypothetical protein
MVRYGIIYTVLELVHSLTGRSVYGEPTLCD